MSEKNQYLSILSGILVISFWILSPMLSFEFLNWDDPWIVIDNPLLREFSFAHIVERFTSFDYDHYMPLTTLSYMIDYQIWGIDSYGFHLTNLIIHLINAFLVALLVKQITKDIWPALLAALIFALHPMHLEVAAWATGRMYSLSTLFWLGSFLFYVKWMDRSNTWQYLLSISLFVFALFADRIPITLPALLLAYHWFKDNRVDGFTIKKLLPFFAMSIAFALITILSVEDSAQIDNKVDFISSLFLASYSYCYYLVRFLLPIDLVGYHPYPDLENGLPMLYYASMLIGLGSLAWIILKKQKGYLLLALLLFSISILPTLKFSFLDPYGSYMMANRYTYFPYIVLSLVFIPFVNELSKRFKMEKKSLWLGLLLFTTLGLGTTARLELKNWSDSEAFWDNVIDHYPLSTIAWNTRGNYFVEQKDVVRASRDFKKVLELHPNHYKASVNLGNCYLALEEFDSAIVQYTVTTLVRPNVAASYYNRGIAYARLGNMKEAEKDFLKALELNDHYPGAANNLANVYANLKAYRKAIDYYNLAERTLNGSFEIYKNRAIAHFQLGQFDSTIIDLGSAIQIYPNEGDLYYYRSQAYFALGQTDASKRDLLKTESLGIQVDPNYKKRLGL